MSCVKAGFNLLILRDSLSSSTPQVFESVRDYNEQTALLESPKISLDSKNFLNCSIRTIK